MTNGKVVGRLLWSLALAAVLATGGLWAAQRLLPADSGARAGEAHAIYVQLEAPGAETAVYRMASGARVKDLFAAARVPVPRGADGLRELESGRAWRVEASGGYSEAWMSGDRLVALGVPMDLNECGLQDLVAVPGIGQATAMKILQARVARGRFDSLQEVGDLAGLGQKTLEALQQHTRL